MAEENSSGVEPPAKRPVGDDWKPASSWSVARLKEYLRTRGGLLRGTHSELLLRAKFYSDNPEAAKTKRGSRTAVPEASEASSDAVSFKWPDEGWSRDSSLVPDVNSNLILGHLMKTGKRVPGEDRAVVAQKPLRRGYDFFFGGYVHDVKVQVVDGKVLVDAKCWASQKKNQKYQQHVVFEEVDVDDDDEESDVPGSKYWDVSFAECLPCVAGTHGGFCQHVFAVLMALEAYGKKSTATLPGPESITSAKQQWGPRTRQVEPQAVMSSVVERPKPDDERKGKAIACTLYEARGSNVRDLDLDTVSKLKAKLPNDCRMKGMLPGSADYVEARQSQFGKCFFGSPMSYQLKAAAATSLPVQPAPPTMVLHTFPPFPFSRPETNYTDDIVRHKLTVPLASAQETQKSTIAQSSSQVWRDLHKSTLTASSFHRITHARKPSQELAKETFHSKSLDHLPAIQHGKTHEPVAVRDYVGRKKSSAEPVVVQQCGLCLDTDFSYLGASPDRLVFDVKGKSHGVLEVKCPHKHHRSTLSAACTDSLFCCAMVDGIAKLKEQHPYYAQVQGQMAITGSTWCDFVVWLSSEQLSVERIAYKPDLWLTSMLPALVSFYVEHAKPYLSSLGQPSRTPQEATVSPASAPVTSTVASLAPIACQTSGKLCFVCKLVDQRILRECRSCHKQYHHCCQVKDEDGKVCDGCFTGQGQ